MLSFRLFIALKLFIFHIRICTIYTSYTLINKLWYMYLKVLEQCSKLKVANTSLILYIFSDQVYVSMFSLGVYSLALLWLSS